jgi:hypothetical protein
MLETDVHSGVYGLVDPRTQEVFYIGFSTNPQRRFNEHKKGRIRTGSGGSKVVSRIRDIKEQGFKISMVMLESTSDKTREKTWIQYMLGMGVSLLNTAYTPRPPRALSTPRVKAHVARRKSEGRPIGKMLIMNVSFKPHQMNFLKNGADKLNWSVSKFLRKVVEDTLSTP